jgi:hypothetical protein
MIDHNRAKGGGYDPRIIIAPIVYHQDFVRE